MEIFLTGNLLWLREIEIRFAVKAPDSRFCVIFDDGDKNLYFFKMISKNFRNLKNNSQKFGTLENLPHISICSGTTGLNFEY